MNGNRRLHSIVSPLGNPTPAQKRRIWHKITRSIILSEGWPYLATAFLLGFGLALLVTEDPNK